MAELVPPGVVSTPWASLRLLSRVTTMPASARLAHAADPCAISYQFNQYTPLVHEFAAIADVVGEDVFAEAIG